jgi:hypothetical protein
MASLTSIASAVSSGSVAQPPPRPDEAPSSHKSVHWEPAEPESGGGLSAGYEEDELTDDEGDARDAAGRPTATTEQLEGDSAAADCSLLLAGAVDAIVPALGVGETHEHIVGVGSNEPGGYRLTVECVDLDAAVGAQRGIAEAGPPPLIASTFIDCSWG